eukprot:TRINITY_DN513_c0_g2_i2.p2 TRINITY_DN513_c0_g2~~TRINITY_DN513_c0_g2_i2.p2  ORF type:complete len:213 (+),score=50.68 TRINITY_DN513_c0_g2_i2:135-773(+)
MARYCVLALLFVSGAAAFSLRGYEKQHRELIPALCQKEWKHCKADAVCNNCLKNGNVPQKPKIKGATCHTFDKWWYELDFTGVQGCATFDQGKSLLSLLLYCRYDSYSAEAGVKCEVATFAPSAAPSGAPSTAPTAMPLLFADGAPGAGPKAPGMKTKAPVEHATPAPTVPVTNVKGPCGICGAGCGCKPGFAGCQCGPEFPGYKAPVGGAA